MSSTLPAFERRTEALPSGLHVELVRLSHLQSATISFLVRAGSRYESLETNGLSHLLEHMLYRGTQTHPTAYEFSLAIERLGGTLEACTHVDFTQFSLTLPPESVVEGLGHLAEFFCTPVFDSLGIEKKIIREELLEELDDAGNQIDVDNISRKLLFAKHPLAFPIAGTIDNVQRFEIDDVSTHFRKHYTARNSAICVAGVFDIDEVYSAIAERFAGLDAGDSAPAGPPPSRLDGSRFAYVHHVDSQTDVRLCFPVVGMKDERAMALRFLERVLDDGLSARLHYRLSDQLGLAYDTFAGVDLYEDCGAFDFGASVEHEKVPRLVSAMRELIDDLTTTRISPDELDKVRTRYIWDLRMLADDPDEMTTLFGTNVLFDMDESPAVLLEQAMSVDATGLLEVAQAAFEPDKPHLACVGTLDESQLAELSDLIVT